MSTVPLLIADHDDPDVKALTKRLEFNHLPLGLPTECYKFSWVPGEAWLLEAFGQLFTPELVRRSPVVIFRRWRSSPPAPLAVMTATPKGPLRSFVERQWAAVFMAVLEAEYGRNPVRWSISPLQPDLKLRTIEALHHLALLPPTSVELHPPKTISPLVWKAIDENQSFGHRKRVTTVAVEHADVADQPCPGVYQQRIDTDFEVRAAYAFGEVGLVAQYPKTNSHHVDRRYIATLRQPRVCQDLEDSCRRVADTLGLRVFTADILVDTDGRAWWCDVNPDGLFSAADSPDGHLIATLARGIRRRTEEGLPGGD